MEVPGLSPKHISSTSTYPKFKVHRVPNLTRLHRSIRAYGGRAGRHYEPKQTHHILHIKAAVYTAPRYYYAFIRHHAYKARYPAVPNISPCKP